MLAVVRAAVLAVVSWPTFATARAVTMLTTPDTIAVRAAASNEVIGWSGFVESTGYDFDIDRAVVHGGVSSGHARRRANGDTFAAMNQSFRADVYRGKRVRFSAYVKTQGVTGPGASIWMRIDGNGGPQALDNMQDHRLTGTADWTLMSVILDVPADADGIAIGLLFSTGGDVWIDDATFEVVGANVPAKSLMPPAPNADKVDYYRSIYAGLRLAPINLGFEP